MKIVMLIGYYIDYIKIFNNYRSKVYAYIVAHIN